MYSILYLFLEFKINIFSFLITQSNDHKEGHKHD